MPNPKIAKHLANPAPLKKPKSLDHMVHGGPLAWRFSGCDKAGPFCWNNFESVDKFKEIIEKLHEFETKPWDEIMKGGSHPVPLHRLEKVARDRLIEISKDDVDELMSLRLTGKNRVWCIREQNIMKILWWDPNHLICPSLLKGT